MENDQHIDYENYKPLGYGLMGLLGKWLLRYNHNIVCLFHSHEKQKALTTILKTNGFV